MRAVQAFGVGRAVAGTLLLLRARRVVRSVHGGSPPRGAVALARLLGAREAAEGVLLAVRPDRPVARVAATVDTLHLVTMLLVARRGGPFRRLAAAGAVGAVADLASVAAAAPARRPSPDP